MDSDEIFYETFIIESEITDREIHKGLSLLPSSKL